VSEEAYVAPAVGTAPAHGRAIAAWMQVILKTIVRHAAVVTTWTGAMQQYIWAHIATVVMMQ
jgi:hypothetical protein